MLPPDEVHAPAPDSPKVRAPGGGVALTDLTTPIQANIKTITIIVLTTVACLAVFVGFLVKWFVTPEWVDKQLGITAQVRKSLWKEVDSGYSTTVLFHKANTNGDTWLEFFCEPDQKIELFVSSQATGFPTGFVPEVTIQLNGIPIDFQGDEIINGLPHTASPKDVTEIIKTQKVKEKLQTLRISSQNANNYPEGFLVINALILVSNNVEKN